MDCFHWFLKGKRKPRNFNHKNRNIYCLILQTHFGSHFFLTFLQAFLTRWRALKEPRVALQLAGGESYQWIEDAMGNGHVLREYSVEERVFGYRDSEIVREGGDLVAGQRDILGWLRRQDTQRDIARKREKKLEERKGAKRRAESKGGGDELKLEFFFTEEKTRERGAGLRELEEDWLKIEERGFSGES